MGGASCCTAVGKRHPAGFLRRWDSGPGKGTCEVTSDSKAPQLTPCSFRKPDAAATTIWSLKASEVRSASAMPSPTHLTGQVRIRWPWARQSDEHIPSRGWFLEQFLEGVLLPSARGLASLQLPPGPAGTSHGPPEPPDNGQRGCPGLPASVAGPSPAGSPARRRGPGWLQTAPRSASCRGRLSAAGEGGPRVGAAPHPAAPGRAKGQQRTSWGHQQKSQVHTFDPRSLIASDGHRRRFR